jgi:hypothetical protein
MADQNAIIIFDSEGNDWPFESEVHTPHIASTLLECMYDQDALQDALNIAVQVCLHMHVPVQEHFRHVYVPDPSGSTQEDWALSDFAFYLLLLNGKADNADVAYAQAYAIHRAFCR